MSRPRLLVALALLLVVLIPFHRPLLLGEAFVPGDLLSYLSPWKAQNPPASNAPAWNVLRFDGIAQFYPWRVEAARQVRAGRLPVTNPYQFAASGGTPLLANSQSAPLYPLHALFYIAPPDKIWYVFGLVSALHLGIAASGLYVLLRASELRRGVCVLGAATWALSAPVICWLSLPSFLGVSCWLPWLLLLIRVAHARAGERTGRLATLGAGGVTGLLILAGHLQIALYVLLAAGVYAAWYGITALRAKAATPPKWAGGIALVAAIGICLAAPQVLPVLELSRLSHRAVTEKTPELYTANTASALPVRGLIALTVPDVYGHPNSGLHWNNSNLRDGSGNSGNNYAEWAMYVGILPLLLAVIALITPGRVGKMPFALLALLALMIATGTPLNRLLFYAVPGYASLANPGRVLIVWAFAVSALAAFGADALLDVAVPSPVKRRGILIGFAVVAVVSAVGAGRGATWAREAVAQIPLSELIAQATPALMVAGLLAAICAALLFAASTLGESRNANALLAAFVLVTVGDLAFWGYGYNPSCEPDRLYPVTPGIAWLQKNAPDARIAVINREWTLGQAAPRFAALPPNALTVYGLHDISGYDSLFPKAAKAQVTAAGGGEDASPPANGNMVFVKQAQTALRLGAEYIVFAGDSPLVIGGTPEVYRGDDLVIVRGVRAAPIPATNPPLPRSVQTGLAMSCLAGAILAAGVVALRKKPRR